MKQLIKQLNQNEIDIDNNDFNLKFQQLEYIILNNQKKLTAYDYLRYKSLHTYFKYWKKDGLTKIETSEKAAKEIYNKGIYKSRVIRKLGNYWIENGSLPISTHGCHQKTKSFIDDEDIINCSLTYIRANGGKTAPQDYKIFLETKIFSQITVNKSISIKTARIWLHKLGLTPQSRKKGIYFDGHEREDVIQYRQQFLKTIEEYEKLMPIFIGDEMQMVLPELKEEEKLHI